jgi:hypothetical protein
MEISSAMLADAASVADGKLYINGGGWNAIFAQQVPVVHPALTLVVVFKFAWNDANEDFTLALDLVDEDDQPTSVSGMIQMRSAPAPFAKKAADFYSPYVQPFYQLSFERAGNYRFRIRNGEKELVSVPLGVVLL